MANHPSVKEKAARRLIAGNSLLQGPAQSPRGFGRVALDMKPATGCSVQGCVELGIFLTAAAAAGRGKGKE